MSRQPYPTDVSDEEWTFVAPYLTLMTESAPQRSYDLREVFNGLRWLVRSEGAWRLMPHDLPAWSVVYQQTQRWLKADVFQTIVHDLRIILRLAEGRTEHPSAVILDGRTLQSTPESGSRAGYDGGKPKKGSKIHIAVDTFGYLLTLVVTPGDEQDRAQVKDLAQQVQQATGETVEIAFVDQGYTGDIADQAAAEVGIQLSIVKLPEAKKGFVLLPRRWVVERSFAWVGRFRPLARDYERLGNTLAGLHFVACLILMLKQFAQLPLLCPASPIVVGETINREMTFLASRYNQGEAAYLNCSITQAEYEVFSLKSWMRGAGDMSLHGSNNISERHLFTPQ